jgi:hypothetical protein
MVKKTTRISLALATAIVLAAALGMLVIHYFLKKYMPRMPAKPTIEHKMYEPIIIHDRNKKIDYLVNEVDVPFYIQDTIDNNLPIENIPVEYLEAPVLEEDYGPIYDFLIEYFDDNVAQIRADSQNIHDTTVQDTIKSEYNKIKEENEGSTRCIDDEIIGRASTIQEQDKVRKIINMIKTRNGYVSNINAREYDVLHDTWNSSDELQKEQVVKELVDSLTIEDDTKIYCPTGVVSRIISSKFITDPENFPKPSSVYRQEMIDKASKVSIDYYKNENEEQESGYKELLLKTLEQDYSGILSKEQIYEYTKDWIDSI